ncbi:hypothetical protein [Streptomyces sp. G-G2]|uniref:hypothetical protein n=1 Tax=Streptomyces sp. G-G2 TaxID=3046201 RepID=UPI0024B8F7E3|nr:hypothetical protein [Streptomyces sp. G-G2]MDJ0384294.1 hypothetical protein [Streptomyces sp. G-G2]
MPVLGRVDRWGAVALALVCGGGGVAPRVARFFTYFDRIRSPLDMVPTVCFGAGGGLAVALLLYGLLVRLRHHGGRGRTDRQDRARTGDRAHDRDRAGTRTPAPTS